MASDFADAQKNSATRGRDRPWLIRTYSGHSTAEASNQLFRDNLDKGQTGLSVAFDLPTQTGLDPDHPLALGEVGKVGVPISHLGHMERLFDGIPLDQMNTSMTANATAPWLLALYIAAAKKQGVDPATLSGTVQNDIIKEYLSRGTYIFPPAASLKLETDVIAYTSSEIPKWNPVNICSYHLQEAGAEPHQELAFAMANAICVLENIRTRADVSDDAFPALVGRISFFLNAGMRFVTELCKVRAFSEMWDEVCRERFNITDAKLRRFRYGVQVNSLGLTEEQPENNSHRILIEMLAVVLSKNARARAVQLPAWNEALGLPRPWDQQWSMRMQQIMAFETDLLEFDDLFDGSKVVEEKVATLKTQALEEMARIEDLGGVLKAVEIGYMKQQLVEANARRMARIESGEQVVVGVNRFEGGEPSPLLQSSDTFLTPDAHAEKAEVTSIRAWREARDGAKVTAALDELERTARAGENIMVASIAAAEVGVTTGEWGQTLRNVFGEYRAPTGLAAASAPPEQLDQARVEVENLTKRLGTRPRLLVAKPGLDGHSNGAEQVALMARDAGFEVIYEGIRQTAEEIASAAVEEGVHAVGLSVLSGSHMVLVSEVMKQMKDRGAGDVPIVVGGIIPERDRDALLAKGIARIFTPKDYRLDQVLSEVAKIIV